MYFQYCAGNIPSDNIKNLKCSTRIVRSKQTHLPKKNIKCLRDRKLNWRRIIIN